MLEIEVWVCTDKVGSKAKRTMKIAKDDWDEMSASERDEAVFEFITNSMMVEWGYIEP